jgi:hypothetical protein
VHLPRTLRLVPIIACLVLLVPEAEMATGQEFALPDLNLQPLKKTLGQSILSAGKVLLIFIGSLLDLGVCLCYRAVCSSLGSTKVNLISIHISGDSTQMAPYHAIHSQAPLTFHGALLLRGVNFLWPRLAGLIWHVTSTIVTKAPLLEYGGIDVVPIMKS